MTNLQLQNLIIGDAARIVAAIATGAGWEVWMQVELTMQLRANQVQAAREVPYPPPNQAQVLDILAQDALGIYAIELKVESANNAGAAIMGGIDADLMKIAGYIPNPGTRWVVGLGYSNAALNAMQLFAANPHNNAIFAAGGAIGVLVVTV
ncbi:hypothetical protein [Sorangium sp. So ce1000]|uniref:hypothetical protein n=1 Tax=Sorangium sp. So ce1000 TaxID=3133325 RepID=UPI003F62B5EC